MVFDVSNVALGDTLYHYRSSLNRESTNMLLHNRGNLPIRFWQAILMVIIETIKQFKSTSKLAEGI